MANRSRKPSQGFVLAESTKAVYLPKLTTEEQKLLVDYRRRAEALEAERSAPATTPAPPRETRLRSDGADVAPINPARIPCSDPQAARGAGGQG